MERTAKDLQKMFLNLEMLVRQYRENANAILKDLELKSAEIVILQTLMYYPDGLSAASLCCASDRDKAQISRTLHELQHKGYIIQNPEDEAKQRKKRWTLTGTGRQISEQMLERNQGLYQKIERDLYQLGSQYS